MYGMNIMLYIYILVTAFVWLQYSHCVKKETIEFLVMLQEPFYYYIIYSDL